MNILEIMDISRVNVGAQADWWQRAEMRIEMLQSKQKPSKVIANAFADFSVSVYPHTWEDIKELTRYVISRGTELVGAVTVLTGEGFNQCDHIVTNPKYAGQSIAVKFYVFLMKFTQQPIVSGSEQTGAGKQLWEKLANTPGVYVYGWDKALNKFFDVDPEDLSMDEYIYGTLDSEPDLEADSRRAGSHTLLLVASLMARAKTLS